MMLAHLDPQYCSIHEKLKQWTIFQRNKFSYESNQMHITTRHLLRMHKMRWGFHYFATTSARVTQQPYLLPLPSSRIKNKLSKKPQLSTNAQVYLHKMIPIPQHHKSFSLPIKIHSSFVCQVVKYWKKTARENYYRLESLASFNLYIKKHQYHHRRYICFHHAIRQCIRVKLIPWRTRLFTSFF